MAMQSATRNAFSELMRCVVNGDEHRVIQLLEEDPAIVFDKDRKGCALHTRLSSTPVLVRCSHCANLLQPYSAGLGEDVQVTAVRAAHHACHRGRSTFLRAI
jgi:hypothetical protein